MFNLETAIVEWRKQMLAAGIKRPVPLEELQNHLREDIVRQTNAGQSEAEAFEIAIQRMGKAGAVRDEFEKMDEAGALKWKWTQILIAMITGLLSLWVAGASLLGLGNFSALTAGQRTSCVVAAGVFSMLIWLGRLAPGIFPVIGNKRVRDAICIACCVGMGTWWIALFNFILPRHDFNIGQLMVAILWGMIAPTGIFLGLTFGIENRARKIL